MDRFEKLVMPATFALALLLGCNRPKEPAAPAAIGPNIARELDTTPARPPALVSRLKAYGTLMFLSEGGKLRTSACLTVDEILAQAGYDGAEPALNALLHAFKSKDEKAYNAITVAEQSSTGTKCPYRMKEFFSEFENITPQRIDHVYAFDNLVLVDAVLRMPARDFTFAYDFERSGDGKLQYAPCSEQTAFYAAVRSWLNDPRVGDEFNPRCPADVVERATHRVPFGPDPARAGALLLRGAPIAEPGDLRNTAAGVTAALKAIELAAEAKDIRAFQRQIGPREAAKYGEWWPTASAKDRDRHAALYKGLEPFFIFDASPLVIAYVRQNGGIQVMYFVPAADGRLIWVNRFSFTEVDRLFKTGPLRESASAPNPFSNFRIN
jgi:hypothetical protein